MNSFLLFILGVLGVLELRKIENEIISFGVSRYTKLTTKFIQCNAKIYKNLSK